MDESRELRVHLLNLIHGALLQRESEDNVTSPGEFGPWAMMFSSGTAGVELINYIICRSDP